MYARGLPRTARAYIDARKNCEDIAMQLLVSRATRKPPVYVRVPLRYYLWAKWEGFGVAGISSSADHHDVRGGCITDLSRIVMEGNGAGGGAAGASMGGVARQGGGAGRGGKESASTPLVSAKLKAWEASRVETRRSKGA